MRIIALFLSILLFGCGTRQEVKPLWVSQKPIDRTGQYIYGIGSTFINPNSNYQQAARSNALADLAQEVESEVVEESKWLQKEDARGFNSSFESNISARSSLKLMDYEMVETYVDEYRYYVLYRLDLPAYLEKSKAQKEEAVQWVNVQLEKAQHSNSNIEDRLLHLADALDKIEEFQLFQDFSYRSALQSSCINALRSIEAIENSTLVFPESIFYLGIPKSFEGRLLKTDQSSSKLYALESSSGVFTLTDTDGRLGCSSTGRSTEVRISLSWNLIDVLTQANPATLQWIKSNLQWHHEEILQWSKTPIHLIMNENKLLPEIAPLFSKEFMLTSEKSALRIECRDHLKIETASADRIRASIEAKFMVFDGEELLWSSSSIQAMGLSSSEEKAFVAAKNEFADDVQHLIIPQIIRNLPF